MGAWEYWITAAPKKLWTLFERRFIIAISEVTPPVVEGQALANIDRSQGLGVRWQRVNEEQFEYAIQQGPCGDEFVRLLSGIYLRRACPNSEDNGDG